MYKYWVYMLRCRDATYYTGVTNNLARRLHEHATGLHPASYVATRLPFVLVYSHAFTDIRHAIAWEKRVKHWSKKKKEALIRGDFDALHVLAACRNETSSRLRSN